MTSQQVLDIMTEIRKLNPKLNDWEKGFLLTILSHKRISTKQERCLMNIYAKATGGGIYQQKQYFKR